MKIAILGTGRVGTSLGRRWGAHHSIAFGSRNPSDARVQQLAAEVGGTAGTFAEAARGADVILLGVPWPAAKDVVESLGDLGSAVLVDATNALTWGEAGPLPAKLDTSAAELVQQWATGGRVVKAFNTIGTAVMDQPDYDGAPAFLGVTADDADAKSVVIDLAKQIGFDAADAGPLAASSILEHTALLWIRLAYAHGHGQDWAFALHRRS